MKHRLPFTRINDALDDGGQLSPQQGAEQLDSEDEAGTEHQKRSSQKDQTHHHVRQVHTHKEMGTWGEKMFFVVCLFVFKESPD